MNPAEPFLSDTRAGFLWDRPNAQGGYREEEAAVVVVVTSIACTGFGFLGGAVGLRMRDAIVLLNLLDAVLLVFCGVNIPTARPEDYKPATQRVVRSRSQPSGVEVHVLPAT